jgi:hypothetical protein
MVARYTPVPVKIDGNLDDSAWKCAAVYTLTLVRDLTDKGVCLQQHGEVRIAWDDKYFYVGVKYYDDDVVAQGKADQEAHFQFGDLAELFLKPKNNTWYWEMYVTPAEKKTRYWFAGSGRLGLGDDLGYPSHLSVAAKVQGTLNNWKDKDESWTGEMAVPISDLTVLGDKFGPGTEWTILVARYNYSRYLRGMSGPELSTTPQLQSASFHRNWEYARLLLEKQPN